MKDIRVPNNKEEFKQLEYMVEFNKEEQSYFDDMKECRDSQFDKDDYQGKLNFYLEELKSVNGRFGDRVAVDRRLKYLIGHAYEALGTWTLEGHDPKERAEMFEQAVLWYKLADETVGFLTDYALRQVEASFGAACFRKDAGLEEDVTEWFGLNGAKLLSAFFSGSEKIIIGKKGEFDYLEQLADKKIDSVIKASLIESNTLKEKVEKVELN